MHTHDERGLDRAYASPDGISIYIEDEIMCTTVYLSGTRRPDEPFTQWADTLRPKRSP